VIQLKVEISQQEATLPLDSIKIFDNVTGLTTIDKKQLDKIKSRLPEYEKGKALIGHSTSQASYSLQTMNMISDSPFARMKQCLSQINKKYQALQEAYFSIEKKKLTIEKLKLSTSAHNRLKLRENQSQIETVSISMENTLRQIGMFQDMYDAIKENNNIPDDWTEKDFEAQEISHMIRSSFRLGIQDMMSSKTVSHSSVEYWEQLGIHPQVAELRVLTYLNNTNKILIELGTISIQLMYDFLDEMVSEFGLCYQSALKRMGLNELGSDEFMAKGCSKPL